VGKRTPKKARDETAKSQERLVLAVFLIGVALLVIGISTSLLCVLMGALFVSGSLAGYLENETPRVGQIFVFIFLFLMISVGAGFALRFHELSKRNCIFYYSVCGREPQHFNALEALDNRMFGLYNFPKTER
jgi:hypothetical protein